MHFFREGSFAGQKYREIAFSQGFCRARIFIVKFCSAKFAAKFGSAKSVTTKFRNKFSRIFARATKISQPYSFCHNFFI